MLSEKSKQLAVAAPDGGKKTINLDGRMLFARVSGGKTTHLNLSGPTL